MHFTCINYNFTPLQPPDKTLRTPCWAWSLGPTLSSQAVMQHKKIKGRKGICISYSTPLTHEGHEHNLHHITVTFVDHHYDPLSLSPCFHRLETTWRYQPCPVVANNHHSKQTSFIHNFKCITQQMSPTQDKKVISFFLFFISVMKLDILTSSSLTHFWRHSQVTTCGTVFFLHFQRWTLFQPWRPKLNLKPL